MHNVGSHGIRDPHYSTSTDVASKWRACSSSGFVRRTLRAVVVEVVLVNACARAVRFTPADSHLIYHLRRGQSTCTGLGKGANVFLPARHFGEAREAERADPCVSSASEPHWPKNNGLGLFLHPYYWRLLHHAGGNCAIVSQPRCAWREAA